MLRLGLLSDTHGNLPDRVLELFAGVDRIVHAGDVGTGAVLEELATIAPVTAVRGNCDVSGEAATLPPIANIPLTRTRLFVVHERAHVPRPLPEGVGVVVFGHTHVPQAEERERVLWVNPGSPSQARRGSGHHVAILEVDDERIGVDLLDLP